VKCTHLYIITFLISGYDILERGIKED